MKTIHIIANFKSNLTLKEANEWIDNFNNNKDYWQNLEGKNLIICPSFPLLYSFSSAFSGTSIQIGSQDVSSFNSGAYTGEVNANQLKDLVSFVLVGHSERRKYFKENNEILFNKHQKILENNLKTVYLVPDDKEEVPQGVSIIAYEPVFAIGSGNPDTPENANSLALSIKSKLNVPVLYGGSINSSNVRSFTTQDNIDGILVGGASLDPQEFLKIIQNA